MALTKAQLVKFLEPFEDDTEIRTADDLEVFVFESVVLDGSARKSIVIITDKDATEV